MSDIFAHPWCSSLEHISAPTAPLREKFDIDEAAVAQVTNLGFPRDYVIASIHAQETNHATTTYYLIQSRKIN
jgi:hypothetical protein